MSVSVHVDAHYSGEDVHVGGVELEVDVGGTQVVAGGHNTDHDQGQSTCVVQGMS